MKFSISTKIQLLLSVSVIFLGVTVCSASYITFNNGFTKYAHDEITTTNNSVQYYLSELEDRSAGVSASIASRPDIIAAVRMRNVEAVQTLAVALKKQLSVDFITIADSNGMVIGRGHSDKTGDSVKNQQNVASALEGQATRSVEEGTVVKFSLRAGVPVFDGSRIIGTVTAGYDLATDSFVDSIKQKHAVECTIFQGDVRVASTILDDSGNRIIGTKLNNARISDSVLSKAETFIGRNTIVGKTYDTAYQPIKNSAGKSVGMIFVGKDMSVIDKELDNLLRASIVLTIVFGFATVLISFFFVRSITNPIRRITVMLKDISEGSGDLTKRLEVNSKDEIGIMASYFNLTLDKVKDLVVEIEKQSRILSDIGIELSSNMNETAASVNQISSNIASIKNQTINQSASVIETNSTMEQITNHIEKLNVFVSDQSNHVAQSSSAIEEMLANISSVSNTLSQNAKNIQELEISSEKGKSDLSEVSEEIRQIAHDSEGLIEISNMIQNIASQTNLLSMNAAIEAAHAGNAGRGFAVVADEIRKLAESAAAQAKTISNVLQTMKSSISRITESSDVVQKQFDEMDAKIKQLSELEDGIRRAMEEQGSGSNEILNTIGQLNDITVRVKSGSDEMLVGSEEVVNESKMLGRITEEVSGSMTEMASGIEQITTAIVAVNQIAQNNKECIDALKDKVNKFKIS